MLFRSNCFQNGVLAITLASRDVEVLARAAERGVELTVDLEGRRVATPDRTWHFTLDAPLRTALLWVILVLAVLVFVQVYGEIKAKTVSEAIRKYGIDPSKPDPTIV